MHETLALEKKDLAPKVPLDIKNRWCVGEVYLLTLEHMDPKGNAPHIGAFLLAS